MQLKAVDCISLFCIYPTCTFPEEIMLPYTSLCVACVCVCGCDVCNECMIIGSYLYCAG